MASIIVVLSGASRQMPGRYKFLPAVMLSAFIASPALAAERSAAVCTNGDLVRRVIIEVGDLNSGLPCEVVYWKDKEAPGVRRVLWTARTDAAFCDGKAAGLVDTLANAGWRCDGTGDAVDAKAPLAPPAAATSTATAAVTNVPTVDAAAEPSAPAAQTQQYETAAASTAPELPATQTAPAPALETQTAAIAPETAAGAPAGASMDQLQSVIQTNLSSLNQSVDGSFQAQIGEFGDLDSDGIDDAVVFFNYESSSADFTQFVAAYIFNGESYHLAATKPVGGNDLSVRQVEVEDIVEGSIQLRLLLNDAADNEVRRAAMVLKDGQLVETQ